MKKLFTKAYNYIMDTAFGRFINKAYIIAKATVVSYQYWFDTILDLPVGNVLGICIKLFLLLLLHTIGIVALILLGVIVFVFDIFGLLK